MTVISKVTSKRQITLPKELEEIFPIHSGSYISWRVEGEKLIGVRMKSLEELAGSLKPKEPKFISTEQEKAEVQKLRLKEYKKKYGKN